VYLRRGPDATKEVNVVLRPAGSPGVVRPVDGTNRLEALHRGLAAVHVGEFLPLLRAGTSRGRATQPIRHPKVDDESRAFGLDRTELGALLVQAGLGTARDHALILLLAVNGPRISEALGADMDDLDHQRGHRSLKILRKGGKHATVTLAPRTSSCEILAVWAVLHTPTEEARWADLAGRRSWRLPCRITT
jgi:site-specific recombinase XerC